MLYDVTSFVSKLPVSKERQLSHKQDDAFNRTWWSVLSIDKLVTWQHFSIERTGHHAVLLKVPNDVQDTEMAYLADTQRKAEDELDKNCSGR